MPIYRLGDIRPEIPKSAYVAPAALVIGNVRMEESASIWPSAVVRGDNDAITIGRRSNVQDGAALHVDRGHPLRIGEDVTIGHGAVVHGCTIGDNSLVGINATVLNDVRIGKYCIVGAGSVVPEGKKFPDRSLIIGIPAKIARQVTDAEIEWILWNAKDYADRAQQYRSELNQESE